jgi:hypothetical protein
MFARGVVYLHAAHLPVPKTLAAKSSVSVSSKLIEIKGFQLRYFGHLRKTGGRGSYQLRTRHPNFLPYSPLVYPEPSRRVYLSPAEGLARRSFSGGGPLLLSPVFPLHTEFGLVSLLFPLHTQKQGSVPPAKMSARRHF